MIDLLQFPCRVGEHERYVSEGTEKEYQVEKIFIHPDYNYPSVINNDIAVLKLQSPIQFNKYVSPVCLPDNDVPVGTECYITGQFLKIHFRFSIDDFG